MPTSLFVGGNGFWVIFIHVKLDETNEQETGTETTKEEDALKGVWSEA